MEDWSGLIGLEFDVTTEAGKRHRFEFVAREGHEFDACLLVDGERLCNWSGYNPDGRAHSMLEGRLGFTAKDFDRFLDRCGFPTRQQLRQFRGSSPAL